MPGSSFTFLRSEMDSFELQKQLKMQAYFTKLN